MNVGTITSINGKTWFRNRCSTRTVWRWNYQPLLPPLSQLFGDGSYHRKPLLLPEELLLIVPWCVKRASAEALLVKWYWKLMCRTCRAHITHILSSWEFCPVIIGYGFDRVDGGWRQRFYLDNSGHESGCFSRNIIKTVIRWLLLLDFTGCLDLNR